MVIQEVALLPQVEEGKRSQAGRAGEDGLFLVMLMLMSQILGEATPKPQLEGQVGDGVGEENNIGTSEAFLKGADVQQVIAGEEGQEEGQSDAGEESGPVVKTPGGKMVSGVERLDGEAERAFEKEGFEQIQQLQIQQENEADVNVAEEANTPALKTPLLSAQIREQGEGTPIRMQGGDSGHESLNISPAPEETGEMKEAKSLNHPMRDEEKKIILEDVKVEKAEHRSRDGGLGEIEDKSRVEHASAPQVRNIEGENESSIQRVDLVRRIANAIVNSARTSQQTVRLRLEPPHLGTLRLHIVLTRGEELSCTMQVENTSAQRVLEGGLGRLRAVLEDAGFTLQNLEITLGGGAQEEGYNQSGNGGNYRNWGGEPEEEQDALLVEKAGLDLRA